MPYLGMGTDQHSVAYVAFEGDWGFILFANLSFDILSVLHNLALSATFYTSENNYLIFFMHTLENAFIIKM